MYTATLIGGPLDGQDFQVPMVKPTMTVAKYEVGPWVVIDPDYAETPLAAFTYRKDTEMSQGHYVYRLSAN